MVTPKAKPQGRVEKIQRVRQHRPRLQLAKDRIRDAERERTWAIVAAYQDGVSTRWIAKEVGLGHSRVHQLLRSEDATEALEMLNQPVRQASQDQTLRDRLLYEATLLRQSIAWLRDLADKKAPKLNGKRVVVVNVNPEHRWYEPRTFDYERVLKVLERIAGDLDAWGRGHDLAVIADEINQLRYNLTEPRALTDEEILQQIRAKNGSPEPRKR